jgi:hypothetical protein
VHQGYETTLSHILTHVLLERADGDMTEGRLELMKVRMFASTHSFVFGAQQG